MQFPIEIEAQIKEFAQPCAATLRDDWREGSSIIKILKQHHWWFDYRRECGRREFAPFGVMGGPWKDFTFTLNRTWVEWCEDKMIIGPPRYRSGREMAELDDEYLTGEEFLTHCLPWIKTWAEREDYSWCIVRGVPDWAKEEFMASKRV